MGSSPISATDSIVPDAWGEEVFCKLAEPPLFDFDIRPGAALSTRRRTLLRFRLWRMSVREAVARAIYPEGRWDD